MIELNSTKGESEGQRKNGCQTQREREQVCIFFFLNEK